MCIQLRRLCKDLHKRKNWIHIDSEDAGPRGRHRLDRQNLPAPQKPVRDYLGSVLPGVADFPIGRIAELAYASEQQHD
jgi:hypothetical protein